MAGNVIEVDRLSKLYKLGVIGSGRLADDLNILWAKMRGKENPLLKIGQSERQSGENFWALRDISFNVKQGEIVGIIGKNGAGKSTLLKIISQISSPTSGEIRIKGRIASLLEVGTGFHPELTGRENVFLNGAILGMSKAEIKKKLSEIIEFSGVSSHIDTPVKRYSSGMKVRLGFAVAAHLEPEILIVDEVLAVGDAEFQAKCLGKMKDVAGEGRTVLFVSHNLSAVRNLCSRGVVLNEGKVVIDNNAEAALQHYSSLNKSLSSNPSNHIVIEERLNIPAQIIECGFLGKDSIFEHLEMINIIIKVQINEPRFDTIVGINFSDSFHNTLVLSTSEENGNSFLSNLGIGVYSINARFPGGILKPGKYFISISIRGLEGAPYHRIDSGLAFDVVDTITYRGLKYRYRKNAIIAPEISWEIDLT